MMNKVNFSQTFKSDSNRYGKHWLIKSIALFLTMMVFTSFEAAALKYSYPTSFTISGGGSLCPNTAVTLTSNIPTTSDCGGGQPTTLPLFYQWYSNTVNSNIGGTPIAGATGSTYSPPTGTSGTTYYYCVLSWNDPDGAGACTAGSITSGTQTVIILPSPCYCTPDPQSNLAGYISSVSFNTISSTSGFSTNGYSNNSGCTAVAAGATYTLSVSGTSIATTSSNTLSAFIDFNADGDFADAGELIVLATGWNGSLTASNITIPSSASCGSTVRFRLIYEYNSATTTAEAGCSVFSSPYGEVEDYCITITCVTPTCDDGIQNQDETGVDCGGATCPPCVDLCHDGIQNSDETGIDCGGAFCLPCNTNGTIVNSTPCCSNTPLATVYPTNCDQIGTSAYNLNSPVVTFTTTGNLNCPPAGATACGGTYNDNGQWMHFDLASGVEYLQAAFVSGSVDPGNHNIYAALFQGPDCANLTEVPNCQDNFFFSSSSYIVLQVSWTGLDDTQDVWIYLWDDADNKESTYNLQIIGSAATSYSSCPGGAALGEACNLGSMPGTFTTPISGGVLCNGGNWSSNENSTFYSFTADDFTGSLEIENIICNDGTNGNSQFGVWTSCAAIGTYGAGFLGCAVGTSSISLSPLVPGQTYYIAADGFAGDNCAWGFTGTGIVLPVEMAEFDAVHTGREVELDWTTASELNNDYFIVQRTLDGIEFENIGKVSGAGTTQMRTSYSFTDYQPFKGTSYYRLKQVDYDGRFKYSEVRTVKDPTSNGKVIATYNLLGQKVDLSYRGMVVDLYDDGTTVKRIQN